MPLGHFPRYKHIKISYPHNIWSSGSPSSNSPSVSGLLSNILGGEPKKGNHVCWFTRTQTFSLYFGTLFSNMHAHPTSTYKIWRKETKRIGQKCALTWHKHKHEYEHKWNTNAKTLISPFETWIESTNRRFARLAWRLNPIMVIALSDLLLRLKRTFLWSPLLFKTLILIFIHCLISPSWQIPFWII